MNLNLCLFGTSKSASSEVSQEHNLMTLTVQQMANALNISRNTAYELVKQPGFPCFHVGKRILINRDMLQTWLNSQCVQLA